MPPAVHPSWLACIRHSRSWQACTWSRLEHYCAAGAATTSVINPYQPPIHQAAGAVRYSSSGSIPVCPVEPGPEDCCQSGCENCVWEVYNQELKTYMENMQKHHPSQQVPINKAAKQQMVEASMDAFEQLERQLQQQQQKQQQHHQQQQAATGS